MFWTFLDKEAEINVEGKREHGSDKADVHMLLSKRNREAIWLTVNQPTID